MGMFIRQEKKGVDVVSPRPRCEQCEMSSQIFTSVCEFCLHFALNDVLKIIDVKSTKTFTDEMSLA